MHSLDRESVRQIEGAYNTRNPPSAHAMEVLGRVWADPFPAQEMNFTVRDKLCAFGYITLEQRLSPYKTHRAEKTGHKVDFAVITEAGLKALK